MLILAHSVWTNHDILKFQTLETYPGPIFKFMQQVGVLKNHRYVRVPFFKFPQKQWSWKTTTKHKKQNVSNLTALENKNNKVLQSSDLFVCSSLVFLFDIVAFVSCSLVCCFVVVHASVFIDCQMARRQESGERERERERQTEHTITITIYHSPALRRPC